MARKYSKGSSKKVEKAMHEMKEGKLKSGRSGKKVTNPKQAVAIGLSEAREEGKKIPKKKSSSAAKKSSGTKKSAAKKASKKSTAKKKSTTKKSASKKSSSSKKTATKKAATKKKKYSWSKLTEAIFALSNVKSET